MHWFRTKNQLKFGNNNNNTTATPNNKDNNNNDNDNNDANNNNDNNNDDDNDNNNNDNDNDNTILLHSSISSRYKATTSQLNGYIGLQIPLFRYLPIPRSFRLV